MPRHLQCHHETTVPTCRRLPSSIFGDVLMQRVHARHKPVARMPTCWHRKLYRDPRYADGVRVVFYDVVLCDMEWCP